MRKTAQCPICRRKKVPKEWLSPTLIPKVNEKLNKRVGSVRGVLAECCATLYVVGK